MAKDESYLIKPLLDRNYPCVSYGKGAALYDMDGKRYLDACSGAVTASIGHGVDEVVQAMYEQARKVSFVYRSQFTNEPAERLAMKLAEQLPGQLNHSFFVNSGSEATETAIKISIQYWQERGRPEKTLILSRWMSYHGITQGALSLSGHYERRQRFEGMLDRLPFLSPPYPYRQVREMSGVDYAEELDHLIEQIGPHRIAAFIAEPIVGAAGTALVPGEGYYEALKQVLDQHDILFICDEVMTGMGRTGKDLAIEHWDATPDIVTLGKGLSAGYAPLAATVVADHVLEPIQAGSNLIMSGHTFSANPLSCAAGLAVLHYVKKHDLVKRAATIGEKLIEDLQEIQTASAIVGDVRGKGLLIGLEFVKNKATKAPFPKDAQVAAVIVNEAQRQGLLLYPSAAGLKGEGAGCLIAPPFTLTKEERCELLGKLARTLERVEKQLLGAET
ncbi:aspartate aminotransferase family protein [Halalkalibacterium halodurans]|uniref:aspartate aminotransferase family protein n=1 Tax=Halalkalibacterium halodurans TaxID=86665 RepID=UPI002AAA50A4|nr:aspartate aminotransferase family protein [Halalkalibacterium halodurans]MDY7222811.1 aspartate aminotransferase family protein [Halalkalibacterium halodurans]MDY7242032.1 aspartate aminotransferase family protein [Halalkalibacterium halodurans]